MTKKVCMILHANSTEIAFQLLFCSMIKFNTSLMYSVPAPAAPSTCQLDLTRDLIVIVWYVLDRAPNH